MDRIPSRIHVVEHKSRMTSTPEERKGRLTQPTDRPTDRPNANGNVKVTEHVQGRNIKEGGGFRLSKDGEN